jgi:hypothetical protein
VSWNYLYFTGSLRENTRKKPKVTGDFADSDI